MAALSMPVSLRHTRWLTAGHLRLFTKPYAAVVSKGHEFYFDGAFVRFEVLTRPARN